MDDMSMPGKPSTRLAMADPSNGSPSPLEQCVV